MSLNRYAKRRDANEAELLAIVRAFGAVWVGAGPLDGWVLTRDLEWVPTEIKTAQGRYTTAQKRFLAECHQRRAKVFTWKTARDVFQTLGAQ